MNDWPLRLTAALLLAACTKASGPAPAAEATVVPPPAVDAAPSTDDEPDAFVPPPADPPPPEAPVGCWQATYGNAPAETGASLPGPIADCEGCEQLRAGPNAATLHPAVLAKLLQIQRDRPDPPIDEPVLWVNSGRREGKPSKSMHNQGLAIDLVVCGLDSPGTAALLRDAGFPCVIEYYDPDGNPCNMAHGDLRGTPDAKAAYAPGAWKSSSCPSRAVSKGDGCQNQSKGEWSYAGGG
jgi:hypothetical protein